MTSERTTSGTSLVGTEHKCCDCLKPATKVLYKDGFAFMGGEPSGYFCDECMVNHIPGLARWVGEQDEKVNAVHG